MEYIHYNSKVKLQGDTSPNQVWIVLTLGEKGHHQKTIKFWLYWKIATSDPKNMLNIIFR